MRELLYTALDIAIIISAMELNCREESQIIDSIWEGEKAFFSPEYRKNQKKFILDIRYWLNYFYEKPILDEEFPVIQKDLICADSTLEETMYVTDFSNLDLFFKNIRIKILYGKGPDYIRLKLRTLLKEYGYQRRSKILLEYINKCIWFYHLEVTLRGGVPCSIDSVGLDRMLVFRVV